MTTFNKTLITCFSIYIVIALYNTVFDSNPDFGIVGLTGLILATAYLFLGFIFAIPTYTRDIGLGLLTASGICLLIGLSICSAFPLAI
jgi:hypothetical protein